jgi:hypothetical protein
LVIHRIAGMEIEERIEINNSHCESWEKYETNDGIDNG